MKTLDENDRLVAGLLPQDPFEDAVPYDPGPESEPRRARGGDGARPARSIVVHDASEIAKPLPELSYLVPALGIASGAPVLVAGYGFSGKTVSLQSLALSVASGRPAWGVYSCRRGRVLHLDFEQGTRVTHDRYQRLARGMGVGLAELGDRLTLAVNPAVYVDDVDALDVYGRAFEGVDMAIVDSLRAAAPRGDENASDVRRAIDLASRAAEKHGTVVVFIHHARKPKAEDPDGARYKIRGSSALFDAGGSVFVFAAEKDQPTRVSHEKCRNRGITVDDFGLRVEDVALGNDARAGLRVVHLEPEQIASAAGSASNAYPKAVERIASFLREHGEYRGSKSSVCKRIRMGNSSFYAAFAELESRGQVEAGRDERGSYVRAVTTPDTPEEYSGENGSAENHSFRSPPLGGGAGGVILGDKLAANPGNAGKSEKPIRRTQT